MEEMSHREERQLVLTEELQTVSAGAALWVRALPCDWPEGDSMQVGVT